MTILDLMGPDETTVLFSFDDPTGAVNPSGLRTVLGAGLDIGTLGAELGVTRVPRRYALVTARDAPPVEMVIPLRARATTGALLRAGLGALVAWLDDPPGPLRWTEGGVVRYIDLLGAPAMPALVRGQPVGGLVTGRADSLGPVPIVLLRQYAIRGADVTVAGATVPMDPATSTKVRVYPVTVAGDLPALARVKVTMDSGGFASTVTRVRIASRSRGARAATVLTDYTAETGFAQCEASGRGWTITHGSDTAGATDANASPGSGTSVARVTPTTDPGVMARRVRAVRTTKLESLRGTWDVIARAKPTSAGGEHEVQLRWAPSTADKATHVGTAAPIARPAAASVAEYTELDLGRVTVPDGGALGGLAIELWTRRTAGTGNLDLDWIWLCPVDDVATITQAGAATTTWDGADLSSPPYRVTGDPAWVAGGDVGTAVRLNTALEGVGTPPNAGLALGAGRHEFRIAVDFHTWTGDITFRVVNVTDDTVLTETVQDLTAAARALQTVTLRFDGVAGKAYQAQAVMTTADTSYVDILEVEHTFVPVVGPGESVRTDPARGTAEQIDASDALIADLDIAGAVPAILPPGDNQVMLQTLDAPGAGYAYPRSVLGRTPTVAITYTPRYAL